VAAAESQDVTNALGMDCSNRDFGRVHSRPAKIIKGAKKATNYPEIQRSPQNFLRRLASPLYKTGAACAEADTAAKIKFGLM
jgi:hypothetical protein